MRPLECNIAVSMQSLVGSVKNYGNSLTDFLWIINTEEIMEKIHIFFSKFQLFHVFCLFLCFSVDRETLRCETV